MYQYYFVNYVTGDEWVVTGCNSKEDALDYMRDFAGKDFNDWEYEKRKPM